MSGEKAEQPGMETATDRGRGGRRRGGADEQRHCQVSEEETEQGWQAQRKLCVYVYMRDRQNKQFNIKRQSDRKNGGGVV